MTYLRRLGKLVRGVAVAPAIALGTSLAGCSMHPLPQDVALISTYEIVRRLRCEAWEGLKAFPRHDPHVRKIIEGTSIGMEFEFHITETNEAGRGRLEFDRASFKNPKEGFSLDFDASATKTRENTRIFRVVEELTELDQAECTGAPVAAGNPAYPISGAIGLGEIIRTYIRLEKLTDLARDDDVVFSDTLEFDTTVTVGALPKVELVTVAGSFRLTHASFAGTASRHDYHQLTVALSRDAKHADVDLPGSRGNGMRGRSNADRAERRAWKKNDSALTSRPLNTLVKKSNSARNRVLFELQRRRNVREDARVVSKVLGVPIGAVGP